MESPVAQNLLPITFNPRIDQLLNETKPKIIFIHIGKTAGTTIQFALREYLADTNFCYYEYHSYDSNTIINKLFLHSLSTSLADINSVIPIRDPLARWISAWNWDFCKINETVDSIQYQQFKKLLFSYISTSRGGAAVNMPVKCLEQNC